MNRNEFIQLQIGALEARIAGSEHGYERFNQGIIEGPPMAVLNGYLAELQYWKDQL